MSDEFSPDHSVCEHCGEPISWDEVCYTHDSSGFADCYLQVIGGERILMEGRVIQLNPKLIKPADSDTIAEPVEWYVDVA